MNKTKGCLIANFATVPNDVTLKMPAFEWVHVQLHQQKGMISLSPPTICNSAPEDEQAVHGYGVF
ncbi:hypothetical protein ACSRA7_09230 [Acinetobacter baumannii]|uniref:hypothetical protein n=1 Tax=Acinetobacter baumannii TaxID=470 RepID=UPI003EDA9E14